MHERALCFVRLSACVWEGCAWALLSRLLISLVPVGWLDDGYNWNQLFFSNLKYMLVNFPYKYTCLRVSNTIHSKTIPYTRFRKKKKKKKYYFSRTAFPLYISAPKKVDKNHAPSALKPPAHVSLYESFTARSRRQNNVGVHEPSEPSYTSHVHTFKI